jgi:hypothetical protein
MPKHDIAYYRKDGRLRKYNDLTDEEILRIATIAEEEFDAYLGAEIMVSSPEVHYDHGIDVPRWDPPLRCRVIGELSICAEDWIDEGLYPCWQIKVLGPGYAKWDGVAEHIYVYGRVIKRDGTREEGSDWKEIPDASR